MNVERDESDESNELSEGTGRRMLLALGVVVVALAGVVGFFIGSNGSAVLSSFRVFGLVTLPTTAASVALYGMVLAVVFLGVLFGLVEYASRRADA